LFYILRTIEVYRLMWQTTSMRCLYQPARDELSLPSVLYSLSDPVRLRIVQLLAESSDRPCGTFGIPLAKATISHHFKVLREAGVVSVRGEGTQRLNSLRRDDLESRFPGLLDAVLRATDTAATRLPVTAASA